MSYNEPPQSHQAEGKSRSIDNKGKEGKQGSKPSELSLQPKTSEEHAHNPVRKHSHHFQKHHQTKKHKAEGQVEECEYVLKAEKGNQKEQKNAQSKTEDQDEYVLKQ